VVSILVKSAVSARSPKTAIGNRYIELTYKYESFSYIKYFMNDLMKIKWNIIYSHSYTIYIRQKPNNFSDTILPWLHSETSIVGRHLFTEFFLPRAMTKLVHFISRVEMVSCVLFVNSFTSSELKCLNGRVLCLK